MGTPKDAMQAMIEKYGDGSNAAAVLAKEKPTYKDNSAAAVQAIKAYGGSNTPLLDAVKQNGMTQPSVTPFTATGASTTPSAPVTLRSSADIRKELDELVAQHDALYNQGNDLRRKSAGGGSQFMGGGSAEDAKRAQLLFSMADGMNGRIAALEKELDAAYDAEGAPEFSGLGYARDIVQGGIQDFTTGLTSAAAMAERMTFGKIADIVQDDETAHEGLPLYQLNEVFKRGQEQIDRRAAENLTRKSDAWREGYSLGKSAVAAIPQAVVAYATAGGSLGTKGLQAVSRAAQASPGIAATMQSVATAAAKNPNYWTAFLSTVGNDYERQLASGETPDMAATYAILTGLMNAGIEIGGGIQGLPDAVRQGGQSAVMAWAKSMVEEGNEEVLQGIVSRAMENLLLGRDNAVASTTDENAVFNPKTAAKEFGGGAFVGGLLGGAQIGVPRAVNAIMNRNNTLGASGGEMSGVEARTDVNEGTDTTAAQNAADGFVESNNGNIGAAVMQGGVVARAAEMVRNGAGINRAVESITKDPAALAEFAAMNGVDLRGMTNKEVRKTVRAAVEGALNVTGQSVEAAEQMAQPEQQNVTQEDVTSDEMAQALFGQEKTAPVEEAVTVRSGHSAINERNREQNTLAYTLATSIDQVSDMEPVSALTGMELNDRSKKPSEQIAAFFKSLGNKVFRSGFGDVALNDYGVGGVLNHRPINRAKMVSLAAVPDVIRNGRQIHYDPNWKGRGYPSYIFAAPVKVANTDVYVAAVVNQRPDNKFYLSEMVDSAGNYVRIEESPSGNSKNGVTDGAGQASGAGVTAGPEGLSSGASPSAPNTGAEPVAPVVDVTIAQESDSVNPGGDTPQSVGAAALGFDPISTAERLYGTQDGAANSVRPDDMPLSTNGRNAVSRSAVTFKGAQVTPDSFVPLLERTILDTATPSGFRYVTIHNDDVVQRAMEKITYLGWDGALDAWRSDVRKGRISENSNAVGMLLYNNAVNSGNEQLAMDIASDLASTTRVAARTLQFARMLQQLKPETQLYMIDKSLRRFIEEAHLPDTIKIDESTYRAYTEAKDTQTRNELLDEMAQQVAAQIPSTMLDKWTATRYLNMLGNFKTQTRNVIGNVAMQGVSSVRYGIKTALEGIVDTASRVAGKGGIERTSALLPGKELRSAVAAEFSEYEDIILGNGKYNDTGGEMSKFGRMVEKHRTIYKFGDNKVTRALGVAGKDIPVFTKTMEAYRKATNSAMEKGDSIFSKASYVREMAGYLKAHGVTAEQFTDENWRAENEAFLDTARAASIRQAQEDTFRDSNAFSDWMSRALRSSDTPKALRLIGEGLLPFRRTPANIAVRAVEYSPIGLVESAVMEAQRVAGSTDAVTGTDVVNQLAKGLTGTMLTALGWVLAKRGALRGAGSDDEEQSAFDDLNGAHDYSVEVGGKSYTIDWLAPGAIPLFMGEALYKATEDMDLTFADMERVFTGITEPMLQMSMLQGPEKVLGELGGGYGDDDTTSNIVQLCMMEAVSYLMQGLTNTMAGQAERFSEEYRMSTWTDNGSDMPTWLQKELGRGSAKAPGVDFQQYAYIDQWGRRQSNGSTARKAFEQFISPGYIGEDRSGTVESELQRVYDAVKDKGVTGVFPSKAEKNISINGETRKLTMQQYEAYATTKGQKSYQLVRDLIGSREYKMLDDEQKAEAIKMCYQLASYYGAKRVDSRAAPSASSWINKALESELPMEQYIAERVRYGNASYLDGDRYGKITEAEEKYGITPSVLEVMDSNGKSGISQAEAYAYLSGRDDLSDDEKSFIWDAVGGWKTSYGAYKPK